MMFGAKKAVVGNTTNITLAFAKSRVTMELILKM
jgi:hypothetical protein